MIHFRFPKAGYLKYSDEINREKNEVLHSNLSETFIE